ncbi:MULTISPECIES: ubiquinol-cytochrome c reductase iron-sulfur subunit [Haloprofundus]|uniref:ubiquinol-cytochrome c reductase iron-sulfur subunit n=1 Tax=Haloprofundus TaxID=1911573 RepID=UPI000E44851C|nr:MULTISPECIES: ubiquinol-cytochrome c reductase iron-sulfur subunit [Haloprofundus]QCJ46134.1 ubiquinol-cytochrome c reductase iron-sulfur subunit [Haloprofundus sp. MHR1]
MSESDKYPAESGRRRFVKGVVGGATLAGVGVLGTTSINAATNASGAGGGSTQAYAIENVAGPAPRGMPQIPIEIDDEGYIKGVWPEVKTVEQNGVEVEIAEMQLGGTTYTSEWFQYCGVESYEGLSPSYESDNYFLSGSAPPYAWQQEAKSEGDRINISDLDDYETWGNGIGQEGVGKPASGTWRSEDTEDVIPVQMVRSTRIEEAAQNNQWLQASTSQGVIAWLNKCTHFCCVPGYKTTGSSATFGGANGVYCQCHQSVYDPFSVVQTLFVARPRPE